MLILSYELEILLHANQYTCKQQHIHILYAKLKNCGISPEVQCFFTCHIFLESDGFIHPIRGRFHKDSFDLSQKFKTRS